MRNFKRFLALMLAMLMLTGMTMITTGAAEEEADYSDAAQRLAAINILKGDTNGDLMLDQGVTRWHTALFFVQALTGRTDAAEWNAVKESEIFTDVPEYGTAIDYAAGINLIRGRGNGIYGYNDAITYQDMLVMAVRALGYETAQMTYPYGYILAAEKLELNKNLSSSINYTDALTRGETAQIIWNMLGTLKAFIDPVTDKIVYPNEPSASGVLLGADARTTLLEEAGFSQDTIEAVIVDFTAGKLSSDIDKVTLDNGMELNAAHLGITEKTYKSTYLGLPVKLYINTTADKFNAKYDAENETSEAKIVFADLTEFTSVKNLGEDGNIKYTKKDGVVTLTLNGQKFTDDKIEFDLRVLGKNGWEKNTNPVTSLENFLYDSKDGYIGHNSYGEIQYAVLPDTDDDADKQDTLLMLYMPFSFGRYITRSLRYQPTLTDESFVLISTYEPTVKTNKDGTESHFFERLLGENFTTRTDNIIVDGDTSLSERAGKASKEVVVTGASVKNKDYMFYYYNALDNVLNVASAEGSSKSGRLTSFNANKKTVKIDGVTYEYGFAGAYGDNQFLDYGYRYDRNGNPYYMIDAAMNNLATVSKNLTYILAGGRVVFMQENSEDTEAKQHSFAIVSTDADRVAELLDISSTKYQEAVEKTEGLYLDANGNIAVAVLNTTSGKWELAAVSTMEMEYDGQVYDAAEDEFPVSVNLGPDLKNYSLFASGYARDKAERLLEALAHLKTDVVFMVRANKSKVYTLAPVVDACLDFGTVDTGLVFSDAAARTNHIKGVQDADVDAARVTLTAKSVVVAINELGEVGVRMGIQKNANSLDGQHIATEYGKDASGNPATYAFNASTVTTYNARFYSAKAALIVMKFDGPVAFQQGSGAKTNLTVDVEAWGDAAAVTEDETYYIATKEAEVEYERLDDETYNVTVSGLYDLRAMKMASAVTVNVEKLSEVEAWADALVAGEILYMTKTGALTDKIGGADLTLVGALEAAAEMQVNGDDDDYKPLTMSAVTFKDDSTIAIAELGLTTVRAVDSIKIHMATLDLTDYDPEDYDFDSMVLDKVYNSTAAADRYNGVSYFEDRDDTLYYCYTLEGLGETATLSEPVTGQLDQFVIDMAGETIMIPAMDAEYLEDIVEAEVTLTAVGMFDEESGVVTIYLVKALVDAE